MNACKQYLRKLPFLLLLPLLAGLPVYTQSTLDFVKYSTAGGLPSNRVGFVCADPEGFVWAVTSNGLARFDGQQFVPFDHLVPGIQSIGAGNVRLMFADNRGFLWALVFNRGVYQIDLSTLKSRLFQQDFLHLNGIIFPAACQDDKGNLWMTAAGGLACFRPEKDEFKFHAFPNPGVAVFHFCKLADGNLLVATDMGLYDFDVSSFKWNLNLKLWENGSHISLIPDAGGTVWIGDWYQKRGGFRHYDPKKKRNLRLFSALPSHPDSIPSTDFQGFFAEEDRIWLATNDQGLVVFDKKTERFRRYQPDAANPQSLSAMQSYSVTKDKYGNLWVGTAQFLNFADSKPKFISHIGFKDGLIANESLIASVVSPGKVVFGTLSGLSIHDRRQRTFRNVRLPLFNQNPYNNQVIAAAPCDATSFWVNTWSSVNRIDLNTGKLLEYFITNFNAGEEHPPSVMRPDIGTALFIKSDRLGNLWLAARGNLVKFTHQGAVRDFKVMQSLTEGKVTVNCFWIENDRQIIIGANGIVRFDMATEKWERLPFKFPFGDEHVWIDFIEKSKNGGYLVITRNRLFRLDPDHPEKPVVEIPLSFPGFTPNGLAEDDQGFIWLSGEQGLARLSPDGKTATLYEPRHHLNNNFFSPDKMQIAKDNDGNLYFSGSSGVSVIQPAAIAEGTAPTVRIVSLDVNNEPFPLDKAIHHTSQIRLAHNQNNLLFRLSVFNSSVPELNRFAYKIEGVTSDWVALNTQRSLNLTNLAPGTYILRLRGANSDGVWADAAMPLTIVIRPPWWASWWAFVLYAAAVAASVWLFYHFRFRQNLAQQETLRLRELDEFKSRFFTNITHEFRTPLTVILGNLEIMKSEIGKLVTQFPISHPGILPGLISKISITRRNAESLLRLINQLLDLAKLESNTLKINYVNGDVLPYLRYISESLHSFANAQNVMLRVESSEASIVMDYDPERLLTIVHNLLSNAIKFTPGGGKVTLRAGLLNLQGLVNLNLQVADTGTGIPPEDLPKIFDRFYQAGNSPVSASSANKATSGTGIGLSLTKELVKAMGGDISVESRLGKGATFTVNLPIAHLPLTPPPDPLKGEPQIARPAEIFEKITSELPGAGSPFRGSGGGVRGNSHEGIPSILLIEDNPDVVEYLTACLGENYAPDFAYNGRAGIEKALETVPDLIISDVMMPEKDGFEVVQTLKNDERTSHIPIILLTAKADMESRIAGLKRGADAYLAKPFHQEELMVTLQNLLELRRKLQDRYSDWRLEIGDSPAQSPVTNHQSPAPPLEDVFLQKVRSIVEAHLPDAGFSVDDLARSLGISYSVVNRKLTALTGRSTTLVIRDIRLQHAMKLLSKGKMTVSEVAYETGFNDPKFFSRVFAGAYGKPPSAFLKK